MHGTRPSARYRLKVLSAIFAATIAMTTLGGCMSDDKEETAKNAPLPRMSRESAQTWARKFTERLAKSIGEPVGPRTPDARFLKCGGKNGETATDDRFILMYSAWVKVPAERHNEAAHKLREILVDEGYTITTERSYKAPKQSMILEARPKKGGFFIAIQSAAVDGGFPEITLGIDSPCMIPPGATQSHQ